MKKIVCVLFALLIGITFFACSDDPGNGQESELPAEYSYLEYETLTIDNSQTFQLRLKDGSTDAEWRSTNEDAVTVNSSGLILGLAKGRAYIIATKDNQNFVCEVFVVNSGKVPLICLDIIDDDVHLTVGAKYTLRPYLTYQAETYDDAVFRFESANEGIATVDDSGCIAAVSAGETKITISASWRENPDIEKLTVKVIVQ